MTDLWCVRADTGRFTSHFVDGGYAAIGWNELGDLRGVTSKEELYPRYKAAFPNDTKFVVGQQVGPISRFLLDMKAGDYVITPAADTEWLHYGEFGPDSVYYFETADDGCRYQHRRRVAWANKRLRRGDFSVPFQKSIGALLAVFGIAAH